MALVHKHDLLPALHYSREVNDRTHTSPFILHVWLHVFGPDQHLRHQRQPLTEHDIVGTARNHRILTQNVIELHSREEEEDHTYMMNVHFSGIHVVEECLQVLRFCTIYDKHRLALSIVGAEKRSE
ncbi:unnamed protein product [Arctia plantaginis]|uniref:Uncharacterized protein n=1 Tax=Arctia plantaginis TaxID=874455 RepID=A0A8S1BSR5_ARCPL|nr:unnamed protein product [Arctia plantaginis]